MDIDLIDHQPLLTAHGQWAGGENGTEFFCYFSDFYLQNDVKFGHRFAGGGFGIRNVRNLAKR